MEFEGRARISNRLEMTPLIDVVFLLLVFFMLTSTFIKPEAIELDLPASATAAVVERTPITVALDREGQVLLNGESVTLPELRAGVERLLASGAERTVGLLADEQAAVQDMVRVMDELRAAGALDIALGTRGKE
jgi:biopolymer transport protein ExbD